MATYSSYKMIDNTQIGMLQSRRLRFRVDLSQTGVLNGFTDIHVTAHLAAVAIGKFLLE